MKPTFMLLTIIFLNLPLCHSQTLFHKRINESPASTNWNRVKFSGDGFLVIGESFFTEYLNFNYSGDLLNSHKFSQDSFLSISSFNTTKPIFSNSLSDFELFSFDDNVLNIIKTQNFQFLNGKSYSVANALFNSDNTIFKFGKKLSDAKSVVCGSYNYFNLDPDNPEEGTVDRSSIIALFDDQHNILWSNTYTLDGYYILPDFFLEYDNNYTVIGKIGIEGAAGVPNSAQQVFTMRIDKSNGNPIGSLERYSLGTHLEITNASSNNLWLSGGYEDFLSPAVIPTTGLIVKLNQSGSPVINAVSAIQAVNFDISLLDCIEQSADGSVYYSGTTGKFLPSGGWSVDFSHFFVGKLNGASNESVWSTVFSAATPAGQLTDYGRGTCLKELDHTIFAVGTYSGANGNDYFIKINKETGLSSCKNVPVQTQLDQLPFSLNFHTVEVANNVLAFNQHLTLGNGEQFPSLVSDSAVMCEEALGTNDHEHDSLKVYPNPVKSYLHIDSGATDSLIRSVRLFDMHGRVMHASGNHANRSIAINTASLSNGVYFVEATLISGKKLVQKIIKQ